MEHFFAMHLFKNILLFNAWIHSSVKDGTHLTYYSKNGNYSPTFLRGPAGSFLSPIKSFCVWLCFSLKSNFFSLRQKRDKKQSSWPYNFILPLIVTGHSCLWKHNEYRTVHPFIRNCWTEMLARSLDHIIILVHFRSKHLV
jgi:hypothetical protein